MTKVKTGEFHDKNHKKNRASEGVNTYHLVGDFSASQQPDQIGLMPSVGTVDPTQTTITQQSLTTIIGTYYWTRTTASGHGASTPQKHDENGTITSSVDGSDPVTTNVIFPDTIAE